jgi:uncharacterized membrane protein
MRHLPLDVLIAAYPAEQMAEAVLQELTSSAHGGRIRLRAAIALRKDAANDLHIVDLAPSGLLGGISGFVVGVFAGPMGWEQLGATSIRAIVQQLHEGGWLDELRRCGRSLPSGWSALVAVVDHHGLTAARRLVAETGLAGGLLLERSTATGSTADATAARADFGG